MLAKTRGIVLKTINYSETSVVAKIYTETFGLQSYLIHGVRKRKAQTKANNLQLLSLLDMEVYNRTSKEMQHAKELKSAYIFQSLPYDIRKSSIALFMNELLYFSVREEEANQSLFHYLYNSIQLLDLQQENFASFHLHFAVQLSKYLGFGPADKNFKSGMYFDLADGIFYSDNRTGLYRLNAEESLVLFQLSSMPFEQFQQLPLTKATRKTMLEHILSYFSLHLPNFKPLRSHEVLEVVLA